MTDPITLYFDLVSPYAWLALHSVDVIGRASGREMRVVPIAFGALLKRHGQPAPVDIPGKRAHIWDDIRWRAAERGVFGVPTFDLDGRLFWGNDRIPHLLAAAEGCGPA